MAWMTRLSAGVEGERVEPKQQQQHAPGVETLGGDGGEPPESKLAVTSVVHEEQQQGPSPPVTSAEPFPLLLDEPHVVDVGVVSGVALRRESSVTEEFSGEFLGVGKQSIHLDDFAYLSIWRFDMEV